MKSLLTYILESFIDEGVFSGKYYDCLRTSKNNREKFNFRLRSEGHAFERGIERNIESYEVSNLVKECWYKIKKGIETKKYLINQYNSNKPGSIIGLHSSEKTREGYLTVILFIKSYIEKENYYNIEVVTVCKTKTMDGWKEKTEDGKTLNHPERGQLNLWDQEGIKYRGKQDD